MVRWIYTRLSMGMLKGGDNNVTLLFAVLVGSASIPYLKYRKIFEVVAHSVLD
jgi:hypothetical protein